MSFASIPADPEKLQQIIAALRLRDGARAAAIAEVELTRGVRHPVLFHARGVGRSEAGNYVDALSDFAQACSLAPTNPALWNGQGLCLMKLNRFEEAAASFERAAQLVPSEATFLRHQGRALERAQDPAGARKAYAAALRLDPDNADILAALALLASNEGAWGRASDFADAALLRQPSQVIARLVRVSCDIERGELDAAETWLQRLLDESTTTGHARALALSLLGDLRDRQNRAGEAFQAYAGSNREAANQPFVPTAVEGLAMPAIVEMLTAHFAQAQPYSGNTPSRPRARAGLGHAFLLGFPRSGTTLLEQILANHPDIVSLEEKGTIAGAVRVFSPWESRLRKLETAPPELLAEHRENYWTTVRNHGVRMEGKLFVDKGPIYTVDLPIIVRLFPDAKILFAIRDPRDVVWSCFHTYFEINSTTVEFVTLEKAATFYDCVMRLAEHYRRVLPVDIHDLRHEALIADPEGETRRLCDILGVAWTPAMLDFAARTETRTVTSASAAQIVRGVNSEGLGRWRRYADQLAPVMPLLQPWVERFGYTG